MISLTTIRAQLRRYLRSVTWLARDGLSGNGWRFSLIVLSNFVGVSTAATSMGLVILYVKWAGDPYPIAIRGIQITDAPTLWSLVIVGVTALLMGVMSATGIYYAEHRAQTMARNYQQRCMSRVLELAGHRQIGRIMIEFERTSQDPLILQDILATGSRFAAFALVSVVQLVLPVMTLLFATAALTWINWLITLNLAWLLGFYLVPLYFINRGVAKHHRRFRSLAKVANSDTRKGLRSFLQTSGPVRNARCLRDETLFEADDFRGMQDSLYGRILATSKLGLVNSIFLILIVVILLLVFSALISADQASWTELLVYVIALRYAWVSVRQVTARLTKISQFFPEFEKLRDLVRAAERVDRSSRPKALASKEAILLVSRGNADPALGDDDGQIELQRGRPILALYPDLIDRRALERLHITVWPKAGFPGDCVFHDDPAPIANVSVITNALGETLSKDVIDDLNELLGRWGVLDELRSLPQGLNTVLTQNLIRSLSPKAGYAVMAAYCVLEKPSFIFLTLSGLAKTQTQFQQTFLASIEHAHVFILDAMAPPIFNSRFEGVREHIDHVVIVPCDDVLRCVPMSWLKQNITAVDRVLSSLRQQRVPGDVDERLSDEEEMDA